MSVGSDLRLKRDVHLLKQLPSGLKLYRFRYNWSDREMVGVVAQDVLQEYPEAVHVGAGGHYRVNYGLLGLRMVTYESWKLRQDVVFIPER